MNAYEKITAKIIEKLEKGVIPWQKPYRGIDRLPMSFQSKKLYRGINTFVLYFAFRKSPYWLTYKQAKEMGGQVKKGTKGETVVYAKQGEWTNKKTGEVEDYFMLRHYTVFNLEDIDGIECPLYKIDEDIVEVKSIDYCDDLIKEFHKSELIPEIINHSRQVAVYNKTRDVIKTPPMNDYTSSEEYYSTIFHEITHSTGHESRLNRPMNANKKTQGYAKEELIAEMGACFLCNHVGFMTKTIDNSTAYIQGWIKNLKDDPKMVVQAGAEAQKVMDWLNITQKDGKIKRTVGEHGPQERVES